MRRVVFEPGSHLRVRSHYGALDPRTMLPMGQSRKRIETWIWRKPTHTGLLLNYNAYCPKKWKSGLISCLLHRAKLICSNNLLFLNEVGLLRNTRCIQ